MNWPGVFNPGQACSFCGHGWPHTLPCPGHITVGRGKTQHQADCPCANGKPQETDLLTAGPTLRYKQPRQ